MAKCELTAEQDLKNVILEIREVAKTLCECTDKLLMIEIKYNESRKMEMAIDKHIKVLEQYDKGFSGYAGNFQETINFAIETMRKYQQIQEIYKSWRTGDYKGSTECMEEIGEVLKDGNVD